jgi:hypothetical protein
MFYKKCSIFWEVFCVLSCLLIYLRRLKNSNWKQKARIQCIANTTKFSMRQFASWWKPSPPSESNPSLLSESDFRKSHSCYFLFSLFFPGISLLECNETLILPGKKGSLPNQFIWSISFSFNSLALYFLFSLDLIVPHKTLSFRKHTYLFCLPYSLEKLFIIFCSYDICFSFFHFFFLSFAEISASTDWKEKFQISEF